MIQNGVICMKTIINCQIGKSKNQCIKPCKHRNLCKLYVIKTEEGVVQMKRLCKNAKLPIRGTARAIGYDLPIAQATVVLTHGKLLVKTSLAMALPPGCYGRIALKSGLTLKKFIDVETGVTNSDYRGELGVILFNFGSEDFIVNMGDKSKINKNDPKYLKRGRSFQPVNYRS